MVPTDENRTLSEWMNEMLQRRELREPDGRQLYQYRITDAEFNDFEITLKRYVSVGQSYLGFAGLARRPSFPVLFVLYGAEWWRRRYDGSGFAWEPILRDLGADADEWNHLQRSQCVKEGLRMWRLRTVDGTGLKFLGSIALQGGLPMKPLAQARGGIGQLLSRVLRTVNNRSVAPADIQSWVESLQHWLPKSYRQPTIYALLTEVAWTVLTLKQKAQLNTNVDVVKKLDETIPEWRNEFPLPIEDSQAQSLIEQLMREAVSVRLQKSATCLPLERFLKTSDENFVFVSEISLPERVEANQLAKLFETDLENLPRFAELTVSAGDKTQTATMRKMAGSSFYRIEETAWDFSDETAAEEHLLKLSAADGRAWTATAARGQSLDDDLPWVFSADGPASPYPFVRQGAGGVSTNEAVIALPPHWKIVPLQTEGTQRIGVLESPPREILKISETVFLEDESGSRLKISVSSVESESESYEWRGRRLWHNFISPSIVFKGKPKFYRIDDNGNALPVNSSITCKAIGSNVSNHWLGPTIATFAPNGEIRHKSKMAILPEDAAISIKCGDAFSGQIVFEKCQLSNAVVVTAGVTSASQIKENAFVLALKVDAGEFAPDQVKLDLYWRHTSTPLRLMMPFPSKGVRAFDSSGRELLASAILSAHHLLGVRLNVLSGGAHNKIKLVLQAGDRKTSRKHLLKTSPGALRLEVKLTDFLTDIEHLLSLDDNPDSRVKISLFIEDNESFAFYVARYANLIERRENGIALQIDDSENVSVEELSVLTMRLEEPGEEPETLEPCGRDNNGKLRWNFSPETRLPGSWLVFPAKDTQLPFRPTLWTVPGETTAESELALAIICADQHERNNALKTLIETLAENYAHPGWEEIARLAEQVGHLPLSTLDIWRKFAQSAAGMAALAFRYGKLPAGFVSRFERELPFAWEVIPFSVWKKALEQSFDYCNGLFGEQLGQQYFEAFCKSRIDSLTARYGALAYLLGIASSEFFTGSASESQFLRTLRDYARDRLFNDDSCLLQNLFHNHAEDEWIEDTEEILAKKWADASVNRYFYGQNLGYRKFVINFPIMLAARACQNRLSTWLRKPAKIHQLRTFRAFDADWFDEAYNWTVVRCLADGLLDNQTDK